MENLHGAIFDLDGTLLDSMGIWRKIDVDFLGKRGIEMTPDYPEEITALDSRSAAEYTIRRYGFADTPEMLMKEWNGMCWEAYHHTVQLKPGAEELVKRLFACSVKIAAATALAEELFLPALRRLRLADCFSAFACCNEVTRGKGSPDVYLLAAERIGVIPQNCIVFEDILAGVRSAKQAGFSVCGVFDESSKQDWQNICSEADFAVRNFSQAERLLFENK